MSNAPQWRNYEEQIARLCPDICAALGIDTTGMTFTQQVRSDSISQTIRIDVTGSSTTNDVYFECKCYNRPLEPRDVWKIRSDFQLVADRSGPKVAALVVVSEKGYTASAVDALLDTEHRVFATAPGPIDLLSIPLIEGVSSMPVVSFTSAGRQVRVIGPQRRGASEESLGEALLAATDFRTRLEASAALVGMTQSVARREAALLTACDALIHLGVAHQGSALASHLVESTTSRRMHDESLTRRVQAQYQMALGGPRASRRPGLRAVRELRAHASEMRRPAAFGAHIFLGSWLHLYGSTGEADRQFLAAARSIEWRDPADHSYASFLLELRQWERDRDADPEPMRAAVAELPPHQAEVASEILDRVDAGIDVSIRTSFDRDRAPGTPAAADADRSSTGTRTPPRTAAQG